MGKEVAVAKEETLGDTVGAEEEEGEREDSAEEEDETVADTDPVDEGEGVEVRVIGDAEAKGERESVMEVDGERVDVLEVRGERVKEADTETRGVAVGKRVAVKQRVGAALSDPVREASLLTLGNTELVGRIEPLGKVVVDGDGAPEREEDFEGGAEAVRIVCVGTGEGVGKGVAGRQELFRP